MKYFFPLLVFLIFQKALAIELLTYNLGLAEGFVDHYDERRGPAFENLKNSKADVLCLQEVWTEDDRDDLNEALSKEYPYKLMFPIERVVSGSSPACTYGDLFDDGSIVTCMRQRCHGKTGREFTACIIDSCKSSLLNLKKTHPYCANALMAQVGHNPVIVMLKMLQPFFSVDFYAYGGSNGLALFSKYPFKKDGTGMISLREYSTLTRRDFLYALLDVKGNDLLVGCTHLTANFTDTAPYVGPFENWEQENLKQTELILTKLEKLGEGKAQAIMGDFNSGPSIPTQKITANFDRTYLAFKAQGYFDPLTESDHPQCTICRSNSLILPTDNEQLIDHIFLKNIAKDKIGKAKIVMDQKIQINRSTTTNMSDHYGIHVNVMLEQSSDQSTK